ncbi:MFS transporter [Amycolatopsis anabasis]|uniref:MFS transporter n=1 Tax=Amycolatopsis anabasis TaxID=1840409 RepID=UPI00131AA79C|nr:MFS transporter [Amycolatopsis anabasis]
MARNRIALLFALGIDNFGSGLFLPLAVVYVTQVVGLPLGQAGTAVTVGMLAGLLVPPLAGRFVDRAGPRAVVIAAQFVQAAGALTYLVAEGAGLVVVAAVLLSAGQQLFYCALFALIADVSGDGPRDRSFALVSMVRSAGFGIGGLVVGALLTGAGPVAYRIAVAADAVTFVIAALVLALLLRVRHRKATEAEQAKAAGPLRDRPFLALIAISGLFGLGMDFFLVGIPVYVLDQLRGPPWLPGAILALTTAISSVAGTLALRATRRFRRTTAMALGAIGYAVWCAVSLLATVLPSGWLPGYLLACTLVFSAASLVFGIRANAIAEAVAPPAVRGRYLAAFQYAFTGAQIVAPAVVALFSVAVWAPWLLVAACAGLSAAGLRWLSPRLPEHAVDPNARMEVNA